MPLIENISLTNQAINTAKTITFSAVSATYEMVHFKLWLYDLAAVSGAKTTLVQIRKNGTAIDSRANFAPAVTTSATSVCIVSDIFSLSSGDILKVSITGHSTDTANVDIDAELWGIPDLAALISSETAGLATSSALGTVSSTVVNIDSRLPVDPAIQSTLMAAIAAVDNGNGGALSLVYTVDVAGVPKEGATVKLFSDSGRTSLVNAKVSNVLGVCTFTNLVAGTYYLTVQLSGYEDLFDSEVVA